MSAATGRGNPMTAHKVRVRFVRTGAGRPMTAFDVVEVRRLLRTDMSLPQIAQALGRKEKTLRNFIRRRNLCDLGERRKFILLQESLRKAGGAIE
jgi:hypothetical protein